MTDTTTAGSGDDVSRLVESAQRLGIELDEADTVRWMAAIAADATAARSLRHRRRHRSTASSVTRSAMLDFSPT